MPDTEPTGSSDTNVNEILTTITDDLHPSTGEQRRLTVAANKLSAAITATLRDSSHFDCDPGTVDIIQAGSTARGTNITGDADIDLFIQFPALGKSGSIHPDAFKTLVEDDLSGILDNEMIDYANHPYRKGTYLLAGTTFAVDIVPCINTGNSDPDGSPTLTTPVDRTPLHTTYLSDRLTPQHKDGIRLLKQFFKAQQIYGADTETQGFSGFLTELLILEYGSFLNTLEGIADWGDTVVIDLEDHAVDSFMSPLTIIDPVDPDRNAAAAVSATSKHLAIAAARTFLRSPRKESFQKPTAESVDTETVESMFQTRDTYLISLLFELPGSMHRDTAIPQLRRSASSLATTLRSYDFTVLTTAVSFAEQPARTWGCLVLELQEKELPAITQQSGPPVTDREAATAFRKAHSGNDVVLTGPYVDGDRYAVEKERMIQTPSDFISSGRLLNEVQHGKRITSLIDAGEYQYLTGSELATSLAGCDLLDNIYIQFRRARQTP